MAPKRSPSYLKQRRLGWYVQYPVPRAAQAAVGAKVLVRSLGTRDAAEAQKLKHAVIAELQSIIAQALAKAAPPAPVLPTAADLLETAIKYRGAVDAGEARELDADAAFDRKADDFLEAQAQALGRDAEGNPLLPPSDAATVRRAYRVVAGRDAYTLASLSDRYLEESAPQLTAQSVDDKRRHLRAFLDWFGADREPAEVTRKVAGVYVGEVIQRRTRRGEDGGAPVPLSPITRRKEISALRSFFDWLTARGIVDANPFDRMASTVRATTRGEKPKRRPWTPAELSTVLHGIPSGDPLWSLTVLAAYSGMRREEVGELKVSALEGNVFRIEEGKTAAAVRRVPIHPTIAPLVQHLAKESGDGYLIPGLLRGGPDRKRAWYVGKRFGRVIRALGITDPALDFHALRGTVITQLEGAGVPESTIQLIVGHKRQGMTFGVYSGGVSDNVKRDALRHVSYGKRLDSYVAETGATVTVQASAKARKRL